MKSPGEYESERQRFIADATSKLKHKFLGSPTSLNAVDRMMLDLENVIKDVLALCHPIQQAGGAIKPDDLLALRHHVFSWTLERFNSWDKETLCMLTTTLIAERIMQQIDSDPWGKGQPDALS